MKYKLILALLLLVTSAVNAQFSDLRDGRLIEDSKGRFIGDIKVLGFKNRATIDAADKTNFLNEFTLKMKVWDYLGEPLEMYAFQWYRKDSYTVNVDNTTRSMSLVQLQEYPDLQKRFLDIRPTKVDIKIFGNAGDGNSSNENRVGKIKVEESNVPVYVVYTYIVKDVDLLIAREGEFREPTVAGSPPTWNEFFNWQYTDPKGPLIDLNMTEDSFKRLSQEEQKQRITKIKNIWKQVKQISVSASIETLEWPEYEMIDIIKTYDRYKNEKKELSPQEKIEAELATVQRTTQYNRNDEWGELPKLVKKTREIILDYDQYIEDDYYSYQSIFVYEDTGAKVNIIDKVFSDLKPLFARDNDVKASYNSEYGSSLRFYGTGIFDNNLLFIKVKDHYINNLIVYDLKKSKIILNEMPYNYYLSDFIKVEPSGKLMSYYMSSYWWNQSLAEPYEKKFITLNEGDEALNIYTSKSFSKSQYIIEKYLEKGKLYYIFDKIHNDYQNYHVFNENLEYVITLYLNTKKEFYEIRDSKF